MISVTITGNLTDDPRPFSTRIFRGFAITEAAGSANPGLMLPRG